MKMSNRLPNFDSLIAERSDAAEMLGRTRLGIIDIKNGLIDQTEKFVGRAKRLGRFAVRHRVGLAMTTAAVTGATAIGLATKGVIDSGSFTAMYGTFKAMIGAVMELPQDSTPTLTNGGETEMGLSSGFALVSAASTMGRMALRRQKIERADYEATRMPEFEQPFSTPRQPDYYTKTWADFEADAIRHHARARMWQRILQDTIQADRERNWNTAIPQGRPLPTTVYYAHNFEPHDESESEFTEPLTQLNVEADTFVAHSEEPTLEFNAPTMFLPVLSGAEVSTSVVDHPIQ